jgi:hypothetical protein
MDVIPASPGDLLDARLTNDIKFYARFLAFYVSEMKKDGVKRDHNFNGRSLTESKEEWKKVEQKIEQGNLKNHPRKHPELDEPGYDYFSEYYYKKKIE